MPTVFSERGVRFVVYPNDHAPPHFHALGAGWEIVVVLGNCEEIKPVIREVSGLPNAAQVRHVLTAAEVRCAELFEIWRQIHGY
ncbi:MAG: DUF4160 domain-containing protein [Betaproteobacteria bacterium]|nr:DUF4160 domain-containing protein [Betaproteobacteria bacterium]